MDQIEPRPSLPRPGRVWGIALGAAFVAALMAWGVEEASLRYYGEQMTTKSAPREYRPDLRARLAGEPGGMPQGAQGGGGPPRGMGRGGSPYGASRAATAYREEFTARAVALSGGAVGVMFGLAMGLALGLAGGSSWRSWLVGGAAAVAAAAACGALGWLATQALVPIFYKARADNPGSNLVIASLLLIRGVPRVIAGLAGGLALGAAVGGGRPGMMRGALGGLIGATAGVAMMVLGDEAIALFSAETQIATTPILRSPLRRVGAILAVTLPSAACAAWAILARKSPDGLAVPAPAAE